MSYYNSNSDYFLDYQVPLNKEPLFRSFSSVAWGSQLPINAGIGPPKRQRSQTYDRGGVLRKDMFQNLLGFESTMRTIQVGGQQRLDGQPADEAGLRQSSEDVPEPPLTSRVRPFRMSLMWDLVDPMLFFQRLSTSLLMLGWVFSLTFAGVGHVVIWWIF